MNKTLEQELENGIGKRALVMLPSFPFFIVGKLEDVGTGCISIIAESGVAVELKGTEFYISIENIAAVFVEGVHGEIPRLK